jgi:hypothetical protein
MAAVRVKSVLGATPRSPSRGETPRGWAQASPIHAYAREGILTHSVTVLHQIVTVAIPAGIALTCIGVAIYLLFLRCGRVYRGGPAPKTANVRVRPGQSYRQALQEGVKRR